MLEGWIKKNPILTLALLWPMTLTALLVVYEAVSIGGTHLDAMWIANSNNTSHLGSIKEPKLKSKWTWLVLFLVGSVVMFMMEFSVSWFRYFIMYTAAGEIYCSFLCVAAMMVFIYFRNKRPKR